MTITEEAVQKIGSLSRMAIPKEDIPKHQKNLTQIIAWVEQLGEVNTDGIEPLTSVHLKEMRQREDHINDGDQASGVLANAPEQDLNMFTVPKVVE